MQMTSSPYAKIMVVCLGNICRSPVAEAMLRRSLPGRQICSAGLNAMVGQGVESTARELAEQDDLDVSQHKAQQISTDLIQWADLILVMSQQQRQALGAKAPVAMGKIMLLGHWLPASGTLGSVGEPGKPGAPGATGLDIPDPYQKSREVFEYVHQTMSQAVALWSRKI